MLFLLSILLSPTFLLFWQKFLIHGVAGGLAALAGTVLAHVIMASALMGRIATCFNLPFDCKFALGFVGAALLIYIAFKKIGLYYEGYSRRKTSFDAFKAVKTAVFLCIVDIFEHMGVIGGLTFAAPMPLFLTARVIPGSMEAFMILGLAFVLVYLLTWLANKTLSAYWMNAIRLYGAVALLVIGVRALPGYPWAVIVGILIITGHMMMHKNKRPTRG